MKKRIFKAIVLFTVLSLITVSFISASAESFLDTTKKLALDKTVTIELNSVGENDYKVTVEGKGKLFIDVSSDTRMRVWGYNSNGIGIKGKLAKATPSNVIAYDDGDTVINLADSTQKATAYLEYKVEKGTYYFRFYAINQTGYGEKAKITASFESENSVTDAVLTLNVKAGETLQLGADLTPADSDSKIKWKTSKKSVATVDSNGLVTAVEKGTATITATVDKIELKIKIKVTE